MKRSARAISRSSLKNNFNEEVNEVSSPKIVEVCGFKDCKRAGGGPKLEKLFNEVSVRFYVRSTDEYYTLEEYYRT
jgi:hypothetical protein